MCPACLSTLALIAAGAGSAGGLAAVIAKKVRTKPAAQAPAVGTPAEAPANEDEIR
jgi:hypothetical protein